jgi:hypothetical protein
VRGTTIQPQVWLSVLTTIMDGLMVFLLVDGGTVYFWRQALHGIKVWVPVAGKISVLVADSTAT